MRRFTATTLLARRSYKSKWYVFFTCCRIKEVPNGVKKPLLQADPAKSLGVHCSLLTKDKLCGFSPMRFYKTICFCHPPPFGKSINQMQSNKFLEQIKGYNRYRKYISTISFLWHCNAAFASDANVCPAELGGGYFLISAIQVCAAPKGIFFSCFGLK